MYFVVLHLLVGGIIIPVAFYNNRHIIKFDYSGIPTYTVMMHEFEDW